MGVALMDNSVVLGAWIAKPPGCRAALLRVAARQCCVRRCRCAMFRQAWCSRYVLRGQERYSRCVMSCRGLPLRLVWSGVRIASQQCYVPLNGAAASCRATARPVVSGRFAEFGDAAASWSCAVSLRRSAGSSPGLPHGYVSLSFAAALFAVLAGHGAPLRTGKAALRVDCGRATLRSSSCVWAFRCRGSRYRIFRAPAISPSRDRLRSGPKRWKRYRPR